MKSNFRVVLNDNKKGLALCLSNRCSEIGKAPESTPEIAWLKGLSLFRALSLSQQKISWNRGKVLRLNSTLLSIRTTTSTRRQIACSGHSRLKCASTRISRRLRKRFNNSRKVEPPYTLLSRPITQSSMRLSASSESTKIRCKTWCAKDQQAQGTTLINQKKNCLPSLICKL